MIAARSTIRGADLSTRSNLKAMGDLISAIVEAVVELTSTALQCLYSGFRAIYSKPHRRKLSEKWQSGWMGKTSLVVSAILGACIIAAAGCLGLPVLIRVIE